MLRRILDWLRNTWNRRPSWFGQVQSLYEQTANETVNALGTEAAMLFVEFANDAIDISDALSDAYGQDERIQSLVHHDFHAMHQRIVGMQFDFLAGRYEAVRWALRFTWESIFRAYLADCFRALNSDHPNPPGPTVDDKADWLANPPFGLNWTTAILPVLRHVFPLWSEEEVVSEFKPVWDSLNTAVHPSGEWRASGVREESTRCVWHHFDEALAHEVLADARAVFAVVFATVLTRFPRVAAALAENPQVFCECPAVRLFLAPDRVGAP
jgi:hypothetical protein